MTTLLMSLIIGTVVLWLGYLLILGAIELISRIRQRLGDAADAISSEQVNEVSLEELKRRISILYDEVERVNKESLRLPRLVCTIQKSNVRDAVERVEIVNGEIVRDFRDRALSIQSTQSLEQHVKDTYEHLLVSKEDDLVTLVELRSIPAYVLQIIDQSDLNSLTEHSPECFKSLLSSASEPIEKFSTNLIKESLQRKLKGVQIERAVIEIDESTAVDITKSLNFIPVEEPEDTTNYSVWRKALVGLFPSERRQTLLATAGTRQKYNWYLKEYAEVLDAYPAKREEAIRQKQAERSKLQARLDDLFGIYAERLHALDIPYQSFSEPRVTEPNQIDDRIKEFYKRVVFTFSGYSVAERAISFRNALHNSDDQITIVEYEVPTIKQALGFYKSKKNKELTQKQRRMISQSMHPALALSLAKQLQTNLLLTQSEHLALNLYSSVIEPETGRSSSQCVFSILFETEHLERLVMEHVDPIASCSRHQFRCEVFEEAEKTVAPIYQIEDERIVPGRDVLSSLQAGTNLAALDWEDFEHLVRQLFQRLFAERGAQVDVTRASKDRGVDAIVYDPTPVTGMGKIVIQAKRYVNLVDVSAVRDLYGTVINEGATKGILVTTSRFGADAHAFAKGKPLEFIDGPELLRLMKSVQMDSFRIDLEEARRLLGLQSKG